jgi:hypothetical protein
VTLVVIGGPTDEQVENAARAFEAEGFRRASAITADLEEGNIVVPLRAASTCPMTSIGTTHFRRPRPLRRNGDAFTSKVSAICSSRQIATMRSLWRQVRKGFWAWAHRLEKVAEEARRRADATKAAVAIDLNDDSQLPQLDRQLRKEIDAFAAVCRNRIMMLK